MNEFFAWLSRLFQGIRPYVIVLPWERAVRVRCGKWTKVTGPGLRFRLPYFDDYVIVNTRLRIIPTSAQTISTRDGKPVTIVAYVGFRIIDPMRAMMRLQNPDASCAAFAATVVSRYITEHDAAAIRIAEMERALVQALTEFSREGFEFEFVSVVDYVIVRTYRLLSEQGRVGVWGDSCVPAANQPARF